MAKIHIGNKIKAVLENSGMSAVDFAKRINRTRDVAYKIFARESVDSNMLQRISLVLEHDFFSYYSESLPIVKDSAKIGYVKKADLIASMTEDMKIMRRRMAELEEKYETLQKLARLQEEKIKKQEKKGKK
ncbi:MAG: hypothetical protein ACJ77K_16840 [Bacteroidia bacterium]|jgi:hypothetical protein